MSLDMRGTVYDVIPQVETDPIQIGKMQIDGVVMNIAIYPKRVSIAGREYNPVAISYPPNSTRVLRQSLAK